MKRIILTASNTKIQINGYEGATKTRCMKQAMKNTMYKTEDANGGLKYNKKAFHGT
jgi:hypothetical protein